MCRFVKQMHAKQDFEFLQQSMKVGRVYVTKTGKMGVCILEIQSVEETKTILHYFKCFPLRCAKKKAALVKYEQMLRRFEEKYHLNPENFEWFRKKAASISAIVNSKL